MDDTLKPDVLQMLVIGKDCGLATLSEAWNNYMNHYDCFFLISDYVNQKVQFDADLIKLDLVEADPDGTIYLKQITIDEVLKRAFPEYKYEEPKWPEPPDDASDVVWP